MGRLWVRSLSAVVLAAAAVLIAWRVLAPAEVLAPATTPVPSPSTHAPGVTGKTAMAPLIVDGLVRVFGAKRQVRADAPVDGKTSYTARWSYRRWPQQLSGVAATGRTVVTRWSDGNLIAIDALTGQIAWRTSGPPAAAFDGHRTGASTVWAPAGLRVTPASVLVTAGSRLIAYAVSTGARLWTATLPAGCSDGFVTSGGAYVCPAAALDTATGRPVPSWPEGPFSCAVPSPNCSVLRDAADRLWLSSALLPVRSPFVPPPGDQLLGFQNGHAVVLTAGRHLQEIDVSSGDATVDFPLQVGTEKLDWKPGLFSIAGGYVAIERLTTDGPRDADAPDHYLTPETVILAAL